MGLSSENYPKRDDGDDSGFARDGSLPRNPDGQLFTSLPRLVQWFQRAAGLSGWHLLSADVGRQVEQAWGAVLLKALHSPQERSAGGMADRMVEVLAAADDGQRIVMLLNLVRRDHHCAFLVDALNGSIPLLPGSSAPVLCVVPRSLIEDGFTSEGEVTCLILSSLFDPSTVRHELHGFAAGGTEGFVGVTIRRALGYVGESVAPIVSVRESRTEEELPGLYGFLVEFPQGHCFVELTQHTVENTIDLNGPFLVVDTHRPHSDVIFDGRSPERVRAAVLEDLSARGYSDDCRGTWIEAAATIFADDLSRVFQQVSFDRNPRFSFDGVFCRRSSPEKYSVLAEVSLRTADGHYVFPSASGSAVLKSVDPVSLLYAVLPVEVENSGAVLNYRLSRIALPISGGLEAVIHSLVQNPRGSLLYDYLRTVLAADLALPPHEFELFHVDKMFNLDQSISPQHLEVLDRTDLTDRPVILVAVEHSRGAHVVMFCRSPSGLFDVVDDIVPLHYFPAAGPLRPRVSDRG